MNPRNAARHELRVSLAPDGARLRIEFPNGHSVEAKAEGAGELMARVLREATERGTPAGTPAGTRHAGVGSAAAPTQRMVEEFLARGGKVQRVGTLRAPPPGITLEDLGL